MVFFFTINIPQLHNVAASFRNMFTTFESIFICWWMYKWVIIGMLLWFTLQKKIMKFF